MGGAYGERRGNRTPCAEANFFDGPEAAQAGVEKIAVITLWVINGDGSKPYPPSEPQNSW